MPIPRIAKEAVKQRLDAGHPVLFVDARLKYPYEHSTLLLPGAVRVAPDQAESFSPPKDCDIVVYDSDPDEIVAARVVASLLDRGFSAMVLQDGLPEWVAAGLPVDTKEARRTGPPAAGAVKG
jgi:ArsR family transcriptional regulator